MFELLSINSTISINSINCINPLFAQKKFLSFFYFFLGGGSHVHLPMAADRDSVEIIPFFQ